ncbi:MAG: hypothetical protein IPP94_01625 [Ignavibacteria bacterium]|nr:hypothetical protein [Ignavibacteria bacterium]
MTPSRAQGRRRALLIFLDGLGIGRAKRDVNPLFDARLPFLRDALGGALPSLSRRRIDTPYAQCLPANATLGVAGLPQSGTGQSTLYTGINTARIIRQHFGPYLYSTLKPVVTEHSLFAQALRAGIRRRDIALANAFPQRFFDYLAGPQKRMVAGMYAAMQSRILFRDVRHLQAGTAVSADITAARWKDIGHPEAPVVAPYEAGRTLAAVTARHRLTLFEYFATDKAGHERSMPMARRVLEDIDAFLRGVIEHSDPASTLVLVTSDHGNLEDLSTKSHTRNPVPVFLFGAGRREVHYRIHSLADITPAILSYLAG